MKDRRILGIILVLVLLASVSLPVFAGNAAMQFLRQWDVKIDSGEGAVMGELVTIVASSGRIVVKNDEDGSFVLQLSPSFKVMEGKMARKAEDLVRGENVVLVLDVSSKEVKTVFKADVGR